MSGSLERLLDKIEQDISNHLIFVGVLDSNAKLLSYRRGKSFSLPLERHDTLDVQLSLMFSLIKQLEDISGSHRFTITRFANHDIFLFGTAGHHFFVITSSTSDGQVAKTLTELVASMPTIEPPVAASTMTSRGNEQSMTPTMAQPQREQPGIEVTRRISPPATKPEAILLLQGYLMALESSWTIQEDVGGFYKIKANDKDARLSWSALEKMSTGFKKWVDIHNIGTDSDGKIYVTISLK